MAVPPSLHLLFDVVASELAAQEQRGEALDSKAGVVLGFAGVLVGLTLGRVNNASEVAGLVAANTAAVLSAAAFMPLALSPLRRGDFPQDQVDGGRGRHAVCERDLDDPRSYPVSEEARAMSDEPANLKLDRPAVEPPPFNPDPELAWDLAGNRRAIKRMKAYLVKLKAEADTEYAARPARQI